MACLKPNTLSQHCTLAFVIRIVLIVYAKIHDQFLTVPYTDIDYKVFTDAARYIVEGKSPFMRHTYRYSPGLALLLTPNIVLGADYGKLNFSLVDIVVAVLINNILKRQGYSDKTAKSSALLWLYNPLTIIISTRGNADSLAVFFVMLTIDLLQRDRFVLAGLIHGLSIHFRLYPIIFSLPMYLSLSEKSVAFPNTNQTKLAFSCIFSFVSLTFLCYYFYGYAYLYESLIYHLIRKDTKHNFSVYFYMLYLSVNEASNVIQKLLTFLPQLLLLLAVSCKYSTRRDLTFGMFAQAMVMVTYNPVLTSQYFFWFLSLLLLSLPRMKLTGYRSICLCLGWLGSQALWLIAAYFLEFHGVNTFTYVWLTSLLFFTMNVKLLNDIILYYR